MNFTHLSTPPSGRIGSVQLTILIDEPSHKIRRTSIHIPPDLQAASLGRIALEWLMRVLIRARSL